MQACTVRLLPSTCTVPGPAVPGCGSRVRFLPNHCNTVAYARRPEVDEMMAAGDTKPLFSFGCVSDVQYADIPDGCSFHGVPRFYRNALIGLRRAVQGWKSADVDFGIHFGDILDGFQAREGKAKSEAALTDVLDCFEPLGRPVLHLIGNHCLYNLSRARLHERLNIPPAADDASYYCYSPHPAWRLLFLDAYDISLLGWPQDHPRHQEAENILNKHNPNQEKNSPDGLEGVQRRFVKFGGGVSRQQLEWLQQQLQAAKDSGQCVIVSSHLPLCPGTCPPACLLWNYEEVLQLLQESGIVAATIAGHTHQNGYLVDAAGIHHLVLPAIVETPPGRDCYGWVEVFRDRLQLKGVDTCMSCSVKLTAAAAQHQHQHFEAQQQQGQRQQQVPATASIAAATADAAAAKLGELHISGDGSSDAVVDVVDDVDPSGKQVQQTCLVASCHPAPQAT